MVKRRTTNKVLYYAIFVQYRRVVSVCKTTFFVFFCVRSIILWNQGFQTLELKLIGPALTGIGVFFALIRVLFCTLPSCFRSCRRSCCCCCGNSEEEEKLIKKEQEKLRNEVIQREQLQQQQQLQQLQKNKAQRQQEKLLRHEQQRQRMPPPGTISSQQQQQLQPPPPPQRSVIEAAAGGRGGGNNNGAVGNIKYNQQVRVRILRGGIWRSIYRRLCINCYGTG